MKYYQENQDEVLHRYAQHQCPTQGHLLQQRQEVSHQKIRSQSFFDPALLVNNVNKLQYDLKASSDYISAQLVKNRIIILICIYCILLFRINVYNIL